MESTLNNKYNIIIAIAMIYATLKITCDPMFFRQISFYIPYTPVNMKFNAASFVFPFTYICCDALVALLKGNRKTLVAIVIVGSLCDGLFSLCLGVLKNYPIPLQSSHNELIYSQFVNNMGREIWMLYYQGVLASICSTLAEMYLFSRVFKKLKNFLISTYLSITCIIIVHHIISDYPIIRHEPDAAKVVISGMFINFGILFCYVLILSILFKINSWKKPKQLLFDSFENSIKYLQNQNILKEKPKFNLVEKKLMVEEESRRPYFLTLNTHSLVKEKFYVSTWYENETENEKLFSRSDYGLIKQYLGGLKAFELGNYFSIESINHDSKTISVLNKTTFKTECCNVADLLLEKKYLDFDKDSIFQFACYYKENQEYFYNNISNKKNDFLYIAKPLRLIK